MASDQRLRPIDLVFLAAMAAALGLWGGSPYQHPDTLVRKALTTLAQSGNPEFFHYPGLLIYLHSLVYGTIFLAAKALGQVASFSAFRQLSYADPDLFFLPGHLVSLTFSIAGVWLTLLLALHLTRDRRLALLAGALLCTSVMWTAETHFATVDLPLTTLIVAVVYAATRFSATGSELSGRQMLVLGILLGLATSAKYNGAVAAVAVAVVTWKAATRRQRWLSQLMVIGVVAVVVFLLTNPFVLVEIETFVEDLQYELKHTRVGHPGYRTDRGWAFHMGVSLAQAMGWPLLVLAGVGAIAAAVTTRRPAHCGRIAILAFSLVFFFVIAGSKLAFQRYVLPVLPFVTIFVVLGVDEIERFLQRRKLPSRHLASLLIGGAAILAVPNLLNSLRHDWVLSRGDIRLELRKALQIPNLRQEATIYLGKHMRGQVRGLKTFIDPGQAAKASLDVAIYDSFSHDRLLYDDKINRATFRHAGRPLEQLRDGCLVELSPFSRDKAEVPWSPRSLYSPYPPDLAYRLQAGPFIELYFAVPDLAQQIIDACQARGIKCVSKNADEGFYFRHLLDRPPRATAIDPP